MADSLHNVLASFRDSILQSIARLEFQMRDIAAAQRFTPTHSVYEVPPSQGSSDPAIHEILSRIESLEMKMSELAAKPVVSVKKESTGSFHETDEVEEIIKIEQPANTRNIIVLSAVSTPALAAAVAAVNPEPAPIALDSVSESDASGEVVEEEESENSVPDLKKVIIKGVSYYMDSSNTVYQETEDGYEEVGTYNPKLDRIEVTEEAAEEEEEEEEAIETEEFVYKGQTYQRDAEGNVYDDEGDVIGHWNGKKIVAAAVA
jgi:hypothetical protein